MGSTAGPGLVASRAPSTPTGRPARTGVRRDRIWFAVIGVAVFALLVIDQQHLILGHSSHWANEDHTLMWLAARDLGSLHFFQLTYYGQSYFTIFGAVPTELFRVLGVGLSTASASSSALLGIGSWVVLAYAAWRRGHRVVALLALAAPIVLSTDSLLAATSAGGRDAGSFLACVGTAVLLGNPRSARRVGWFVAIAGLGTTWDLGSALLVVPVAAYALLLNREDRQALRDGAIGLVAPVAWLVYAWVFFTIHPDYNFFKRGDYSPRLHYFSTAVTHVAQYLAPAEPEIARWYVIPLAVAAVLLVALARTRRPVYFVPPLVAVAGFLYALSTNKITYSLSSVYLWHGRFFLSLPFLLWFLGYLVAESGGVRLPRARSWTLVVVALMLVGATFGVRQATFNSRMAGVVRVSHRDVFSAVFRVSHFDTRCDELVYTALAKSTNLLVFTDDVLLPYACAATYYGTIETIYPAGDRRTWLFHEELHRKRTSFLVGDVPPSWCRAVAPKVTRCRAVRGLPGAVIVRFPSQSFITLWRRLGFTIRHFDG